jgi:ribosomal peptide maturation radical SAM protein 1
MSILLLHMPFATPTMPSLATELLAAELRREGIKADTFYGTLRFPRTRHLEAFIHSVAGEIIFTPLAFPAHAADAVIERVLGCDRATGELVGNYVRLFGPHTAGSDPKWLGSELRHHLSLAERWLERCLADIPVGRHAIYGFSVAFDAQRLASLVLAARLKEREPKCRILFGGTAVDGVMGEELMRAFPWVDVVSRGDADWRICALVRALRDGGNLDAIDGLLLRRDGNIVRTDAAPAGENLDDLPMPNYDSFLHQLGASGWRDERPILLFEASRGCWWGEKHHCRFCGLRADGLHFRRKSGERAAREIQSLSERYPQHRILYGTDSILDYRAPGSLLPELVRRRRRGNWKLFFEIKSNLKPRHVALLAAAGTTTVQPGIESFSDRVLSLMDKGSNARRNVELLKALASYRIEPIYNLIIGTPGERPEDYRETLELLPRLHHLTAPAQICLMQLDRFSPYFKNPASFGITALKPEGAYRLVYPDESIDLERLVYRFEYASAEQADADLRAVWARMEALVLEWRAARPTRALWWRDLGEKIAIIEGHDGKIVPQFLSGSAADLYRLCDRGASLQELMTHLPQVAPGALQARLDLWRKRGWIFRFNFGIYLGLAPEWEPRGVSADEAEEEPASTPAPATFERANHTVLG